MPGLRSLSFLLLALSVDSSTSSISEFSFDGRCGELEVPHACCSILARSSVDRVIPSVDVDIILPSKRFCLARAASQSLFPWLTDCRALAHPRAWSGVPYLSLVGENTALAGDLSHKDWSAARLVLGDRLLPGLNLADGGLFARADIGRSQRRGCTPRALGPAKLLDCASRSEASRLLAAWPIACYMMLAGRGASHASGMVLIKGIQHVVRDSQFHY